MKPPTLNSSACDWWMSNLCFWRPFFFVLFFTKLYDRSFHELEYRWRLSRPLSAGGVGRVAASPCSCPDSFQNRTLHSVGAAQLLSLHLNGPLMTTTFRSTRWGHGGELRRWGRCALDFWNGGWLRKGVGGHPTHKAETAMSEEMPDWWRVGGGEVRWSRFLWRGIKFDGGKVPGEQRTREGKSEGDEPFPHKLKQVMDYCSQRHSFLRSKCVYYEFQSYRDTWRSCCSWVNTSGIKASPAISLVNGEMVRVKEWWHK